MGGGMGGGMRFSGIGGAPQFAGSHFAGMPFAHSGFSPRFAHGNFDHRFFDHRFFDHRFHRFHRFAFIGVPYADYGYYDGCWRRVWTPYGPQWTNVCRNYGYY